MSHLAKEKKNRIIGGRKNNVCHVYAAKEMNETKPQVQDGGIWKLMSRSKSQLGKDSLYDILYIKVQHDKTILYIQGSVFQIVGGPQCAV